MQPTPAEARRRIDRVENHRKSIRETAARGSPASAWPATSRAPIVSARQRTSSMIETTRGMEQEEEEKRERRWWNSRRSRKWEESGGDTTEIKKKEKKRRK